MDALCHPNHNKHKLERQCTNTNWSHNQETCKTCVGKIACWNLLPGLEHLSLGVNVQWVVKQQQYGQNSTVLVQADEILKLNSLSKCLQHRGKVVLKLFLFLLYYPTEPKYPDQNLTLGHTIIGCNQSFHQHQFL